MSKLKHFFDVVGKVYVKVTEENINTLLKFLREYSHEYEGYEPSGDLSIIDSDNLYFCYPQSMDRTYCQYEDQLKEQGYVRVTISTFIDDKPLNEQLKDFISKL